MKTKYCDIDSIIYEYDSLTSTQTEAKRLAMTGIRKAIIVADKQTSGKGRCGRSWESPHGGGLYVSFLIAPKVHAANIHLINFAAGLAVAFHLRDSYGINAALKWPNDVIVPEEHNVSLNTQAFQYKKICGILSESAISADEVKYCITGMGINCKRSAIPPELSSRVCAIDDYVNNVDKRDLLKGISDEFTKRLEAFESNGAKSLIQDYVPFCSTIGKAVQIETGDEVTNGIAIGLGESGELLVNSNNETKKFTSADVYHAKIE